MKLPRSFLTDIQILAHTAVNAMCRHVTNLWDMEKSSDHFTNRASTTDEIHQATDDLTMLCTMATAMVAQLERATEVLKGKRKVTTIVLTVIDFSKAADSDVVVSDMINRMSAGFTIAAWQAHRDNIWKGKS